MFSLRAFALVASLFTTQALAVPLPPGSVIFPTGTTFAAQPELGGTVINDNLITETLGGPLRLAYSVQNRVVRSDLLNTLIFGPRIRDPLNLGFTSRFEVLGFRLEGYGMANLLDVNFRTDGLGDIGPSSVSRSADGNLLTFRFDDPLLNDSTNPPGIRDESLFPSIVTDATHFNLTGTLTILGRRAEDPVGAPLQSITFTGLAVPAAIPLPATGFLLLAGIAGLGGARRRKNTRGGGNI